MLELDDIEATIEGVTVLRDGNVDVGETESVAIVGRNGAGKTSTFRTVMGLRDLDHGTVTFRGEDITDYETYKRKRLGIGFAPEDRQLISKLTARENIEMSLWGSDDESDINADERLSMVLDVFPAMEEFLGPPGSSRAANSRWSRFRARSSPSPNCCSSTSPSKDSHPASRRACARASRPYETTSAHRCSSPNRS